MCFLGKCWCRPEYKMSKALYVQFWKRALTGHCSAGQTATTSAVLVGPIRQHQILRLQEKSGTTFGCFLDWTRGPLWTDLSTWVVGWGKYENEKQQPTHFGSKALLSGWACLLIMSCCNAAAAYLPVLTINAALYQCRTTFHFAPLLLAQAWWSVWVLL